MATQTLISEAEYLSTPYENPAPEYIDGLIVERSTPNNEHSRAQVKLTIAFGSNERLRLYPRTELRVHVGPQQYRVADLLVYADAEPTELVPPQIPLVAVEIVSPNDLFDELMIKLADYEAWGVPHVWIVDPALRQFSVYANGSLTSVQAFELAERGLRIELASILR